MLLSFIMPAYKALFLDKAISSIVGQTCGDWELVVVDDCSPEDLKSIVDKYSDPRISYHRNERNIGGADLIAQWHHSIGYARGEWVVLAGDDDVYKPQFCGEVLQLAAAHPEVDLIRAGVEVIDCDGGHVWDNMTFPELVTGEQFIRDSLDGSSFICVGNFAFRKSALDEAGGFVNFPSAFCSDIATPILLSGHGVCHTAERLFQFRESGVNLSGDKGKLKEKLEANTQLYDWLESNEVVVNVFGKSYLHSKCIYDYFNHIIKYVPMSEIPAYLSHMTKASFWEKSVMVARWVKNRICK